MAVRVPSSGHQTIHRSDIFKRPGTARISASITMLCMPAVSFHFPIIQFDNIVYPRQLNLLRVTDDGSIFEFKRSANQPREKK